METKKETTYSLENWAEIVLPEDQKKPFLEDCENHYGLSQDEEVSQKDFEDLYQEFKVG